MILHIIGFAMFISIHIAHTCEYRAAIQAMLPAGESLATCEKLTAGSNDNLDNTIILCTTAQEKKYIFRTPKKLMTPDRFETLYDLAVSTGSLEMSPKFLAVHNKQHILMDYISPTPWPSYQDNEQPYTATMQLLKRFHDTMRWRARGIKSQYAPYTEIYADENALIQSDLPYYHIQKAFEIIRMYRGYEDHWLSEHATMSHGDCKLNNVLLQQVEKDGNTTLRPWLIDFDCSAVGHPYFDVAKLLRSIPEHVHTTLFRTYLGHEPTEADIVHLEIMKQALRMIVATIRCKKYISMLSPKAKVLSKKNMEYFLQSDDPLPSQSTISMSDPSVAHQQLGAIYALHEFLKAHELLSSKLKSNP